MKKPKAVVVVHAKRQYISQCCNEPATKAPCAMEKDQRVSHEIGNQPKDREATLGKWRCRKCGRRCKVAVQKQETNAQGR